MGTSDRIAQQIIHEQETIIGPVAWMEARKVRGLRVEGHDVHVDGVPRDVLDGLVKQYERLFGRASREVCRDAVRPLISQVSQEDVPAVLR